MITLVLFFKQLVFLFRIVNQAKLKPTSFYTGPSSWNFGSLNNDTTTSTVTTTTTTTASPNIAPIQNIMYSFTNIATLIGSALTNSNFTLVQQEMKEDLADNMRIPGIKSESTRKFFQNFTSISNRLYETTDSLWSCSTGICILAITLERYIFIGPATQAAIWLSKKRHKILCAVFSTLIPIGASMDFLDKYYFQEFICLSAALRLTVILVFFAVPIGLCLFLFSRIAQFLRNMLTHQERNQQVTRAFAATHLTWRAFWTPRTVFTLVELVNHNQWFELSLSRYTFGDTHHKLWDNFFESISLLYSTVTPIIFKILLRSAQEPFIKIFNWITGKCACRNKNTNTGKWITKKVHTLRGWAACVDYAKIFLPRKGIFP